MKFSASRLCRFCAAGLIASFGFSVPTGGAEGPAAPPATSSHDSLIRIANGKITNVTKDGQPVPATLRNIVDMLREEYRGASITIVGVDNVMIENVTLRLAPRNSALRSALTALAEASGRKFRVQDFSEQDVVLMADRSPVGNRIAEVFNLGPLLNNNNQAKQLERQLRDAETNLAAVRKVMGSDHPRVKDITTEIELIKAHLAQVGTSTGWQEGNRTNRADREYHPGALKVSREAARVPVSSGHEPLIVVGGDEAIEVTRKVVAALEKGAN